RSLVMMRSLSTSALGQPSETMPTRGAAFFAAWALLVAFLGPSARRAFGAGLADGLRVDLAVACGMAGLVAKGGQGRNRVPSLQSAEHADQQVASQGAPPPPDLRSEGERRLISLRGNSGGLDD